MGIKTRVVAFMKTLLDRSSAPVAVPTVTQRDLHAIGFEYFEDMPRGHRFVHVLGDEYGDLLLEALDTGEMTVTDAVAWYTKRLARSQQESHSIEQFRNMETTDQINLRGRPGTISNEEIAARLEHIRSDRSPS